MLKHARERCQRLQDQMAEQNIPVALFSDQSSIAYLAGFWGYLGIEFGRPTLLLVYPDRPPVVITPLMESEMVSAMTWVEDVRTWEDSGPRSWAAALSKALPHGRSAIWIEKNHIPAIIRNCLDEQHAGRQLHDISPLLAHLRMIKTNFEIDIMRKAGAVAGAMMKAAHESLEEGTPEYESALQVMRAGTEKAAGFLTESGWQRFVSPLIHNLQILQSGSDSSMVHRRASLKRYEKLDPVYFCFCNMAEFQQYKLGFDRMFHIIGIEDEAARVQQAAIDAQQAAIAAIRPGVLAEDVAEAANVVYRERGYSPGYRTGRSIGISYLEAPELKAGDKTVLQVGMTFAVDGGISIDGSHAGRIGDSIVVTDTGSEYLTDYPRQIFVTEK